MRSYEIPKKVVLEAFKKVKENRGAEGIDEVRKSSKPILTTISTRFGIECPLAVTFHLQSKR